VLTNLRSITHRLQLFVIDATSFQDFAATVASWRTIFVFATYNLARQNFFKLHDRAGWDLAGGGGVVVVTSLDGLTLLSLSDLGV